MNEELEAFYSVPLHPTHPPQKEGEEEENPSPRSLKDAFKI